VVLQPDLADVELLSYGLGIQRDRFDYRFNPRKGIGIQAEGSVGRKKSTTALPGEADQPEPVHTTQYELNGLVVGHLPLGGRGTVRLVAQGGAMVNDLLFANELFRIGGIRGMRGVDEASIYCSSYAIGTAELRFILEENSNAFVFFDQGWWEDQSQDALVTDAPIGFGAGTSFETKAGIFSLTYALGRQFENPIELREGKVHFGFTSLF
jgi:hemolysin activation/secretion protein